VTFLKNSWIIVVLLFFLTQKIYGQCNLTVNTINEYNCVTAAIEATVIVNSATPPYTVTSNPPGINIVVTTNTFTFTNLPVTSQGDYTVNVFASGTCSNYSGGSFVIPTSPSNVVFSPTAISCYGGSTGAVSSVFTSGNGPYTWLWSTGSTSSGISGLSAGIYTVNITNEKNCTATRTISLINPPEIASQLTATFIPCFGTTIPSAITTTGGVSPFSYTVNSVPVATSPGSVAANITVGLQTIITRDSKGCLKTNTVLLSQAAQQIITHTVTQPNCPGESNGAIQVNVTGPVAGYTYSWNPSIAGTNPLTNIPAGNYTAFVSDASSCTTKSVIALPPAPLIVPLLIVQKENCSAVDGAFTLNVSGGHPPFTYTTLPANSNGTVITGLSTGNYTTIIKDANGCLDTTVTYVGNLSTVSLHILTVTAVQCYNTCNGSVIFNVQNGVQPITYSVTGMPSTTNNAVTNLCAGFYAVRATDNIGCPAFDTIRFPQLPVFSYSAATPPTICIGKKAELKALASGGSGNLSYIWNPGNINGAVVNVEPVITTTYNLNVYDSKGCTLPPYQVVVNVNAQISINVSSSNAGICPGTTAQITPTVSGGDGNYSFLWLPDNSKGSSVYVESITIPAYTLIVKDGCGSPPANEEINIKLHPVIQPLYTELGKGGCMPYCTQFKNVTPGSKNAIWNFGDKPIDQQGDVTDHCYEKPGNFNLRLTLTDSNSCKTSYTYLAAVNVLVRPGASFITNPTIITLNESENVLIKNTTDNASFYKWYIDGEYIGMKQNINYFFKETGCYDIRLIAENQNQCIDSTTRSICVFEGFNFYMPNAFTPNNDGLNDVLLPKGTGWLYDNYKFEVFNRWGHKIFSTTTVSEGWNGGAEITPGVSDVISADPNDIYVWRARVTDNMQKEHDLKGFVMVVR